MKRLAVAFVGLGALMGSSFAADVTAPYYNPPPQFLPIDTWTGFYIGANAGWIGSSGNTIINTGTDTGPGGLALGLIPGTIGVSHNGLIGGGQIGYNWQYGPNWVWGIEADFDGTSAKGTAALAFPGSAAIVPSTGVFSRELDTLGTVRARAWVPLIPQHAVVRHCRPRLWPIQVLFCLVVPGLLATHRCRDGAPNVGHFGRMDRGWWYRVDVCSRLEREGRVPLH